jgi:GNAT superfamily N-acetyltransferase
MTLRVAPVPPDQLPALLPGLAQLRVRVFRDFPYLYDGDAEYEERYLATYAESPGAFLVAATEGDQLVGAATGTPLGDHDPDFAAPLIAAGYDPARVFYCAESVLLPDWRGRGIGHAFFDHREEAARRLGLDYAAFCSVIRAADHPARPTDYSPLDAFWRKRGYEPLEGAIAHFSWRDLGDAEETAKPMQVWIRPLAQG